MSVLVEQAASASIHLPTSKKRSQQGSELASLAKDLSCLELEGQPKRQKQAAQLSDLVEQPLSQTGYKRRTAFSSLPSVTEEAGSPAKRVQRSSPPGPGPSQVLPSIEDLNFDSLTISNRISNFVLKKAGAGTVDETGNLTISAAELRSWIDEGVNATFNPLIDALRHHLQQTVERIERHYDRALGPDLSYIS